MAVSLATLKTRLQSDVPARDGVPSNDQYEQAVKDAVADYSRRRPLRKMVEVAIVANTASYSLPSDFAKLIRIDRLSVNATEGVILTSSGIIPVEPGFEYRHTIVAGTLTFYPTPTFSTTIDVWYMAQHTLNGSSEYPDMTNEDAGTVALKAQAIALMLQANKLAADAWTYQVGDERVDKTKQAETLRAQAKAVLDQYLEAAKPGPAARRSSYDTGVYE